MAAERLEHAEELDAVVVATSDDPTDDPLAEFARRRGTLLHRGPLDDVARRILDAAREHELEAVVRVTGDAPSSTSAWWTRACAHCGRRAQSS